MTDIITLYCFGPSIDRKTPLLLFGPTENTADEGTAAFAETLKKLVKWHVESFSFTPTGLGSGVKITHFPAAFPKMFTKSNDGGRVFIALRD